MVRTGGYSAFSFREIAKLIGIKSSSVHYHFPTKEDLGAALAKSYTESFLQALGSPEQLREQDIHPIEHYIASFRKALIEDQRMCLCGILGAELHSLPPQVMEETKQFFLANLSWLERAYTLLGEEQAHARAIQTLSMLEGAMITSGVLGEDSAFDKAASLLTESQKAR